MEFVISEQQALLADLFSVEELQAKREANKDNPKIVATIDAKLEAIAKAETQAKLREEFTALLETIELPEPPEGTVNIFNAYVPAKRGLTKAEKADYKANHPDVSDEDLNAKLIETGEMMWQGWTINKALSVPKGSTSSTTSTRKLAITLNKRDGDRLVPVGNFRTSKEACNHLGLATQGDSARRVLEAKKYVVDSYEGSDFLVKEA
jgi:hypothetical protein